MSCSITCPTKIPTLTIAPFLFNSVGILCEFAIVPNVYILLSPQEEQAPFLLRGQLYTSGSTFIKMI